MTKKRLSNTVTRVIAFVFALLLSTMPLSPVNTEAAILSQPAVNSTGTINASSLRVRNWPSSSPNAGVIDTIYAGETVTVLELVDTDQADYSLWFKISSKDGIGYIAACYVDTAGSSGWASYDISSYVKSGVVTASTLSLRSGPGTEFNTRATLSKGDSVSSVERIDTHASSNRYWLKVNSSKGSGFVAAQHVDFGGSSSNSGTGSNTNTQPSQKPDLSQITFSPVSGTGVVTGTPSLNMRKLSIKESTIIEYLNEGEELTLLAETSNGWYKVLYKDKTGFVSKKYITIKQEPQPTPEPTPTPTPTPIPEQHPVIDSRTRYTCTDGVNFRSSPTDITPANIITSLKKGTLVQYSGTMQDKWAYVCYNDCWGWVYAPYLAKPDSADTAIDMRRCTCADDVKFRSSPTSTVTNNIITSLKKGTVVHYSGTMQDKWAYVCYNGGWGWVYAPYLAKLE